MQWLRNLESLGEYNVQQLMTLVKLNKEGRVNMKAFLADASSSLDLLMARFNRSMYCGLVICQFLHRQDVIRMQLVSRLWYDAVVPRFYQTCSTQMATVGIH